VSDRTILAPQAQGIPVPNPGRWSAPYWEGCRIGELRFQRCDECGTINPKPGVVCHRCHSRSLRWESSRGEGQLYSWTVVWRPQHPSFQVPYAPAIIELTEGWHLMSAMVGCDPAELQAGLEVEVEFHPVDPSITLPYFRLRP
jgi:uncharacterized protein